MGCLLFGLGVVYAYLTDFHTPFSRIGEAGNPGPHMASLGSYNGNCWRRIRDWLTANKHSISFVQEHKRPPGDLYDSMSSQAVRDAWKCCGTRAIYSELGYPMGGTAVCVPSHIGIKAIPGGLEDGFTIFPGRASGVLVDY